jgi:SnoaL-like domain
MVERAELDDVRAANGAYYTALSARSLSAMEWVWARTSEDINVAPPIRPVAHIGWDEIKKNYEKFWSTLDQLTVAMDQPSIRINGPVAWVFGIETVCRRTKSGQASSSPNFGTSIFVKKDGRWRMVFHQAAMISA